MVLPDTVYLGDSLHYNLHIANNGPGQLLWSVDSMNNWILYTGKKTGFNDTTLSLSFSKLPDTATYRIGSFKISSTSTEAISHYVYFVQGTKSSNSAAAATTVTPPSSIVIPNGGDSLRLIYPNPARTSLVNIGFYNPLQFDANLVILNMNGEFVLSAKLLAGLQVYQLDISRLNNGNYYFKVFNEEGLSAVRQIIIQR